MTIAEGEIFDPVLSVIPYEDEEDAIKDRQRYGVRPSPLRVARTFGAPVESHLRAKPAA
jgi:hypothetical protein